MDEFINIISGFLKVPKILELDNFVQHRYTTRLLHCATVSFLTYRECKMRYLNWIQATEAAFLHDFFLYDWRDLRNPEKCHAYAHPAVALENSKQLTNITSMQENIILSHMWPLTIHNPLSSEARIVAKMDKYATAMELSSILYSWTTINVIRDEINRIAFKVPL